MSGVLTVATVGMFVYAAYSVIWPIVDVMRGAQLELWAEAGVLCFGVLLGFSAVLVRLRVPGGLAFALAGLFGLQALAVHNAAHFNQGLGPQIGRAAVGLVLAALAYLNSKQS